MIAITTSHCMNADVCGTPRERTTRIESKYYEFIDDIGSDTKLNFDVTNFAINYTVSCMVEIVYGRNNIEIELGYSSNYVANVFVGVSIS